MLLRKLALLLSEQPCRRLIASTIAFLSQTRLIALNRPLHPPCTWIGLIVLALILAIGMAWSHLYRRWTGQTTVDEVNEGQ